MMQKKRETSFEFIRAICTIGIVLFHYSFTFIEYHIGGNHLLFQKYSNGDWGGMFVAMFFMLSGAVLQLNYGENLQVGKFFWKRFLSIFPMFYVSWMVLFFVNARVYGTLLWGGPKWKLIYSVLGLDGYLWSIESPNYYSVGEWFLGAIILLYVLFPLLRFLYQKVWLRYTTTVILVVLFTANLYLDLFKISDGKNLITCVLDFWIGMLIVTNRDKLKNIYVALLSLVITLIVMFSPIPMKEVMCSTIVGTGWFLCFMYLAGFVMKTPIVSKPIGVISKYSYGIFLVHHVMLYVIMKRFQYGAMNLQRSIGLFFLLFALIFIAAVILTESVGFVVRQIKRMKRNS